MFSYLERIVAWLKAGYPQGVPEADVVPLLALLRRRLSDDEIVELAHRLSSGGARWASHIDTGREVLRITDELPTPAELHRVADKLRATGWQIDDSGNWQDFSNR